MQEVDLDKRQEHIEQIIKTAKREVSATFTWELLFFSVQLVFMIAMFNIVLLETPPELAPLAALGMLIVVYNWRFFKPPRQLYY